MLKGRKVKSRSRAMSEELVVWFVVVVAFVVVEEGSFSPSLHQAELSHAGSHPSIPY
jgi:hypothetical protein